MNNAKNRKNKLTSDQRRILILCMIAYAVLYLLRLNISLALPSLSSDLAFSTAQAGGITSAFFWCYAVGQLVSGWIGERVPARYMVLIGLLGASGLNFLISFSSAYGTILLAWAVNGLFQSMLWSPIMKCVSRFFSGEKLVFASFALSITQVIGYMAAWSISYELEHLFYWRLVFRIPACIALLFCVVWLILFRIPESVAPFEVRKQEKSGLMHQPALMGYLGLISLFAVFFGAVKSSIDTWLPTMLSMLGKLPSGAVLITLLLIPMINFFGVLFSKFCVKRFRGDIYRVLFLLWSCSLLLCACAVFLVGSLPLAAVFAVSLLFGFIYGMTPIFTSFIPLDFVKWNCVSILTGFLDFSCYVGSALSGMASGRVLGDEYRWTALCRYWLILLSAGLVLAVVVLIVYRKLRVKISREDCCESEKCI